MWKLQCAASTPAPQGESHPLLATLNHFGGRQTWEYDPKAGTPEELAKVEELRENFTKYRHHQKHSADELLRLQCASKIEAKKYAPPSTSLPNTTPTAKRVEDHLKGAIAYYECLQQEDGHWPGDYGGPLFLMPGLIIALYTTGDLDTIFSPQHKAEAIRYFRNHQNKDGGFGLHIEGHSTMFGTVLQYVASRLLGVPAEDEMLTSARAWIHKRGGATYITSWGKFWLAVLGVYEWHGLNPMPPEMWLLPYKWWTGIGMLHPGRFWCHCRMVYLPMSYVYGKRTTCKPTPLTEAIKTELYPTPYTSINWDKARNQVAKEDLYYPHPFVQDVLWWTLSRVEPWLLGPFNFLRRRALNECMKHIHYEDRNTRYIDIGPVNKVINMLACWIENPQGEEYKRHLPRIYDYLWMAEDGLKMQGYNGSQLWDTAFAVQALAAANLPDVSLNALKKAHEYIVNSQVIEEAQPPLTEYYRHISKGAWPFSSRDHGWPISDCSSEGLKAALILRNMGEDKVGPAVPESRFHDCLEVILSYQNFDGGMATYENTRSFHALEILNPAETFGDIIVDYSYVECTSACIQAMVAFNKSFPNHWAEIIKESSGVAESFIRSIQRPDGSWYGSWAVCFTYGCWFGVSALAAKGHRYGVDTSITKCCDFILSKQKDDGGWGESYLSCEKKTYHSLPGDSHVVNTSWALLTLLLGGYHLTDSGDPPPTGKGQQPTKAHQERLEPLHRAARFLMRRQLPSGDWPQQTISGVFNRNCMITYANYRNIFPIWALGLYRRGVLLGEEIK